MSKYGAVPTVVDNIRFHSKAEARHYETLKLRLVAGEITNLELQPRYPLLVDGVKIGVYVADFRYQDTKTGQEVVEDVKGAKTSIYARSKKHLFAQYGISVVEVPA